MGMVESNKITYIPGTAKFLSDKVIEVEGKQYTGEHIIIASGSSAQTTNTFPGSDLCMNSDGFFEMEELPESMVCIGGGYIGIEMGQILCALGVKVTLVVRSVMLRFVDRDMIAVLEENMTKLGMKVVYAAHDRVEKDESGKLNVFLKDGTTLNCDECLIALGRPPCLDGLGIENTGITLKKDQSI
jgi:glutathione reductase (NADPH)